MDELDAMTEFRQIRPTSSVFPRLFCAVDSIAMEKSSEIIAAVITALFITIIYFQ